jgi:translation elongation factor EF-1alpha
MVIGDTGLKRFAKIKNEEKISENMEILKLSLCQQYHSLNTEMNKILSHIYNEKKFQDINQIINQYKEKLDYHPDEIKLMNNVVETLYKHGKYYLD